MVLIPFQIQNVLVVTFTKIELVTIKNIIKNVVVFGYLHTFHILSIWLGDMPIDILRLLLSF